MESTLNFQKHTTNNPISKLFLNNFNKTLLSEMKKLQSSSILDVGCGEGFVLNLLKEQKIGKKLEGIESIDEAIRIGEKLHPNLIIKKGDIYKLPYKNNSFDLVMCLEVLEHLTNPQKGLKELVRVSAKYIVLSVPNEPWFTFQRIVRGKNILKLGAHPEHIQHWSTSRFIQLVQNYFLVQTIKRPFPWTLVIGKK